ncbi:MAG: FAD-dependent oxidoreductase, partial [Rhodocyclales bacterium]|nr:FAD-dependent oxidoreductase [Rhodocyclales bacterium]
AGVTVAESLRSLGYAGAITLLGAEAHAPYHRPPLSKGYLRGETGAAQLAIRAPAMLEKKGIALRTGVGVVAIERGEQRVRLADGAALAYDGLALCTGARLRRLALPGADLAGIHGLRTLDDSLAIAAALHTVRRVVIVGGGFIGLEIAAVARTLGKEVTVLEAMERLMARVVAPPISQFFHALHSGMGVAVETGAAVSALSGRDGRIAAVSTADGREFPAELLIVGIGILPDADLAQAAGIACDRGIVVDACSRTSDPAVVAAGDCTARRLDDGDLRRLESVHNAVEQGKSAAAALVGQEHPFGASPWFWSDQYDVKLQMVGLAAGHERVVLRGDPATRKFSVFYYSGDKLIAVDSVNRPEDHLPARKLLDRGIAPTPEQAADPGFALGALLA